jgi:hypothetical protein
LRSIYLSKIFSDNFFPKSLAKKMHSKKIIGIKGAELLAPTADGFRAIVRMAYAAGRARGREEAKHELQSLAESPPPDRAGSSLDEDPLRTRDYLKPFPIG